MISGPSDNYHKHPPTTTNAKQATPTSMATSSDDVVVETGVIAPPDAQVGEDERPESTTLPVLLQFAQGVAHAPLEVGVGLQGG